MYRINTKKQNTLKKIVYFVIFFLVTFSSCYSQIVPGSLDLSFNSGDLGYGSAIGPNSQIYTIVRQPDNKLLIGGNFTSYSGTSISRIARINEDGSLDNTFNPGTGFSGGTGSSVRSIVLQPDGKIIVGGLFTTFDGVSRNRIARLNADGTLDTNFDPGTGTSTTASHYINSVVLQSDGKILIGGLFTEFNGTAKSRIARLNNDGSLDNTFAGTGVSTTAAHYVFSIALQSDGKILIGGSFTSYNGTNINRIARINTDGSLDASFNVGTGFNSGVRKIAVQNDGKILVGGEYTSYNATTANRIIRLNDDGSIDNSFLTASGTGGNSGGVFAIDVNPTDGKILIGGTFTQFNAIGRNKLARLNADGSLDNTFTIGTGFGTSVNEIKLLSSGSILVGGSYSTYNYTNRNNIVRIFADGSVDISFNPETGVNGTVYTTARQNDGKIIIGGFFTHINGVLRRNIARLNIDGSLDTTFNTQAGTQGSGIVETVALQADGKVLVGGYFTSYNNTPMNGLVRLNTDGSLDNTFNPGTGLNASSERVKSIKVQSDGKILIGGQFDGFNGVMTKGLVRLEANGAIDASFNAGGVGTSNYAYVHSIDVQVDGKIILGGDFVSFNGISAGNITRLNSDGSVDIPFNDNVGVGTTIFGSPSYEGVKCVKVTPDGKILFSGLFDKYDTIVARSIARLHTDGSLDTSFSSGSGTGFNGIDNFAVQPDGKIVIVGNFQTYNGAARARVARINSNGTTDLTFDPGAGAPIQVYTVLLQPDGKIIIGGDFTYYDGTGRNRLARIYGVECLPINTIDTQTACGSYTWIDGNTYTANNNTATFTLQTDYGNCDSTITLNLTILNAAQGTDVKTACGAFTWIDGNTYNSNNNTATHTIVGAAANGCDSVVTLNLTLTDINTAVTNDDFTLTATQQTNATYQWINCGNSNSLVNGATAASFTPTENGNYAVIITISNCSDTSTCYSISKLNVNENEWQNNIFFFPNPTNSTINISPIANGRYSITDISGKEIVNGTINDATTKVIDLSTNASGIYLLKITTDKNISITRKIVKQ